MKKIILSIVVLLPMLAHAQFTKGDKVLGGYLELNTSNQKTPDGPAYQYRNFSILPNLGIFINKKLELGGLLGYRYYHQHIEASTTSSGYTSKSKSLTTGLYAQQYFSISEKFLFTLLVQSTFSRDNSISPQYDPTVGDYVESETQHYAINSTLRPTFLFLPSPQWGFRFSLAYINHIYNRNLSTDVKTNQFTLAYGGINLGVSYYFRKVKG